jgi:hypothetical protein
MKKIYLLLTVIVVVAATISCGNESSATHDPLSGVSWQTEKTAEYQLVRPIEYETGAKDAYNLPIRSKQWYLISKVTDSYLLPVQTAGNGGIIDFVETITSVKRLAIIDTVPNYEILSGAGGSAFNGLSHIKSLEVVCFDQGYSAWPATTISGDMTVSVKKK